MLFQMHCQYFLLRRNTGSNCTNWTQEHISNDRTLYFVDTYFWNWINPPRICSQKYLITMKLLKHFHAQLACSNCFQTFFQSFNYIGQLDTRCWLYRWNWKQKLLPKLPGKVQNNHPFLAAFNVDIHKHYLSRGEGSYHWVWGLCLCFFFTRGNREEDIDFSKWLLECGGLWELNFHDLIDKA